MRWTALARTNKLLLDEKKNDIRSTNSLFKNRRLKPVVLNEVHSEKPGCSQKECLSVFFKHSNGQTTTTNLTNDKTADVSQVNMFRNRGAPGLGRLKTTAFSCCIRIESCHLAAKQRCNTEHEGCLFHLGPRLSYQFALSSTVQFTAAR